MAELPPPPDSVGPEAPPPPPPPPPPPDLLAPPGAVGYAPTPMNSIRLDRVGKLATAITVLVGVAALLAVVSMWASEAAQDDARALLDDDISADEFLDRAAPYLLMTTVQFVATLATGIVSMVWMFRIAKNHRTLHRGGTWGPGWAIGGWFLPPLLYIIPTLMFRELWKASDPDVPIGGDWRSRSTSPLIPLWFVVYSVVPIVTLVLQSSGGVSFGTSERDIAEQVLDNQTISIISGVLSVIGAGVYLLLVRRLTDRHRALTGEAEAP